MLETVLVYKLPAFTLPWIIYLSWPAAVQPGYFILPFALGFGFALWIAAWLLPYGDWAIADTTLDTKITLAGQPKGKTLEYRVFARNKAGDGLVSNVIDVVL